MTQQGLRQASARNLSGFATGSNYNEDLLRLFDAQGVPAGTFNQRQLRWINARMGASFTNLDEAMQAYATSQGAYNWSSLGTLEDTANFTRVMPYGATYTRTGVATGLSLAGDMQTFAADVPQRTDRGLALEPAATNLSLRSQEFDNATWTKGGSSISADATAAPDGTTTADKLVEDSSTGLHRVFNNAALIVVADSTYVWSVFAKAAERTSVRVSNNAGSGATFDLANNGATSNVSSGVTTSVLALANGWFRLSISAPANTILERIAVNLVSGGATSYTGDNASGAFLWGAQVELGAVPSSYILTEAISATRSLPVFTESIPASRTKALLTYADATTTLVSSLTAGGTFDVASAVIGASKGWSGFSELSSRTWQA